MLINYFYKKLQLILGYVFIFLIIFFIFFSYSVSAVEYGGIGGRPAFPRDDNLRTKSIFIHTLETGIIQEEGVLVVNNTNEQKTLLVYAVDSEVSSGGAFACKQMAELKKGVGSWIKIDQTEVTLDSNDSKLIPFTIIVPENASAGEHNGCIAIQEKKEEDKSKTGMKLAFRTGLRVAITVPGDIMKKLEIVDLKIEQRKDHDFLLKPSVKNLGNVSIDTDIQVITSNFFGLTYFQHGGQFPILRGEMSDWNFHLKKPFWGGWYKTKFALEYEENLKAEIGEKTGNEKIRLEYPAVWFFSSPKPLALTIEIIIFLIIIFIVSFLLIAKRRKRQIKKTWIDYGVESNDDINSLAEKFNVSWKLLAKVNKLKPPYALKQGEKIKVPPKK